MILCEKVIAPLLKSEVIVINPIIGEFNWVQFHGHTQAWLLPDISNQETTNIKPVWQGEVGHTEHTSSCRVPVSFKSKQERRL